ncbi:MULTISPECIES: hemagglutinin repeat-containing protein [Pantoea]|uniref:hemagglutinin repeat-containing protein n=1 Tax=Pantoea TaxID=53335 RepID=UPI001F2BE0B5|nr:MULTISPECIES: hemagglutinin repeat-containing protein [Pantoea]UIL52383.1 hemagglutinin repeat-containing protein [Pantoea agglomerans]
MNKHCYRIIFSRTHGELRVVSELARSCSTEPGQSCGNGSARLWVTLRRATWLLGLALFAGPAMANGIVADSNATPGQRPDIIATQNGLPQVNITAPNQAGISHNQYQQFDVAQNGAILNNSAVMTSTQLAGMIQGNPVLNPNAPAARVIINEVNSNNPSQLRGYMEVAGGRAQVIVANPAGIVCNGCGTINAGRMTLTTGKPQLNADGSLAGYQVERGVVRIEGGGLNGDPRHDTEYVDVLARAVEINAGVWAKKELAVVAGRNRVSADAQTVTPLADDGSARPELAIDMGQMGGMYSGQIRMIGTEAGVGVRNQNAQVQAGKTLVVSSEGKLVWQSAAQDGVTQAGGDISLAAREDIDYQGKLHSGGQLTVRSREGGITQSGTLAAAGDVRLTAARGIQSSGHLLAGSDASSQVVQEANLQLESQDVIRASGSLLSKKEVSVRGRRVDLSGAQIAASRATLTAQEGGVAVRQAVINGDELVINTAGDIEAQQAQISAGRWQIDGRSLFSQQAGWSQTGSGESRFTLSGGLDNSDGTIESRQLSFRAASLNNQRGRMVALDNVAQTWRIDGLLDNTAGELGNNGDLVLETGSLTNQGGTVKTQAALTMNASAAVNNSQGKLLAGDALTLSAGADLNNQSGTLNGGQLLLNVQHLNNAQGEIVSQRDLGLTVSGLDNQAGQIVARGALDIHTGEWNNRGGTAQSETQLSAQASSLNNDDGKLLSSQQLSLSVHDQISNRTGEISGTALKVNSSSFDNTQGKVIGQKTLDLIAGQGIDNTQGLLGAGDALTIRTDGELNNRGGTLQSNDLTTLAAREMQNEAGKILSGQQLTLNTSGQLSNRSGEISGKSLLLNTSQIDNARGKLIALHDLSLATPQGLDNSGGWIEAGHHLSLNSGGLWQNRDGMAQGGERVTATADQLNNGSGRLQSGGDLALTSHGTILNQGGKLTAQNALAIRGTAATLFNNDGGSLQSGGDLLLQGGSLTNRQSGLIFSQQALTLNLTGDWDNQGGSLTGNGRTQASAANLLNAQGAINALDTLDMQFSGRLDNSNGRIFSRLNQTLQAQEMGNAQGWMGSQASWTATSAGFDNTAGSVQSQQQAELTANWLSNASGVLQSAAGMVLRVAQDINNLAGKISAQQQLTVQGQTDGSRAGNINNTGGQWLSGEALTITAARLDNTQGGLLYSQRQSRLNLAGDLDNRAGKVQSGEVFQLDAQVLNNAGGNIDSQQQLTLQLSGQIDNSGGAVRSNGGQQINAATIDNRQGVFSSLETINLTTGLLENASGTLISQGAGFYHVDTLNNQQGKVHSGAVLTLNATQLNNQSGQMVATQDLVLNATAIDNRSQGMISSQAGLSLQADRFINRDGGLLLGTTYTDISVRDIDNSAGRLQSAGTLMLRGVAQLDNRQGRVLANGDLTINGDLSPTDSPLVLLNQSGRLESAGVLSIHAHSFNNQDGTLLGLQALTLTAQQDYTHNAGETISSNGTVTFSLSGALTNLVDWLLPGNLVLNASAITNPAMLVGKTVQLTTGALLNSGRLEADALTLNVDSLDNSATVMGDEVTVRGRVIDNHGQPAVIAATESLTLQTGERLTNRDGALLYSGDRMHLHSDDLIENRASFIETDGDATIEARRLDNLREGLVIEREAETSDYKWHRYNYYWRSYGSAVSTDLSTMASTTQQLTFQDEAAAQSNPYGTLLAIDAAGKRAQVRVKNNQGQLTELWINYLALKPNADGSYAMTFYETRGYRQKGAPTPYHNTFWREHNIGQIEQWDPERHIDIDSAPFVSDYNNLRERTATGTVTRDQLVSEGIGARILAGGNMILRITDKLLNDASVITANGNLTHEGGGSVDNRGYSVNERRQEVIVDHYDKDTHHWYPTFNSDETTALATVDGIITGNGNVTINGFSITNTTVNQAQISQLEAALQAVDAERAEYERNPLAFAVDGIARHDGDTELAAGGQLTQSGLSSPSQPGRPLLPAELALTALQQLERVATTLPNNGLFSQHTAAGSPYLVVTDERFTSQSKFISSDYLLEQVGYDPSLVHKRLGDGFYEQRLVREQVLKLTGRPSVNGWDAMAQYQELMNNGSKVAQDFHLVPGVALTPPQIAALQQDIVWLVSETVDTADGPQTVWVPKVYLAQTTLRLTGDGAVIGGGNLQLSADSVTNAANLFADKALSIDAGEFLHQSGDIKAGSINVRADQLTISTNLQDALRQATMSADDIRLSGTDITLAGAKLDATDNLSLLASNDLTITAAKSSHTADLAFISGSMGNRTRDGMEEAGSRLAHVSGEWQQALGSELNAGGNLLLSAGRDVTLTGSQANAGGQLDVQAAGDITIRAETTTNTTHLEADSRTSSVSNSRQEDRLLLSTLSGAQGVTLVAGNNLLAEGAQVDSTGGRIGVSAQNVTIKDARASLLAQDSENKREGNTRSHREEESTRESSTGSTFSGQQGVTVIGRENDVTVTGSTLHSEQGAVGLQAKRDVVLNSATERESFYSEERSENKSLLKKSSGHSVTRDVTTRENGSLLSGESVTVIAGRDLTVTGSAVAADRDVSLRAGRDVEIGAATETDSHYQLKEKKKSGLLGSGGIGFTIGKQSTRHEIDEKGTTQSQSVSTVGSSQGSVNITAGNRLHVGGADLVAGQDLNLTGDSVTVDPGVDSRSRKETFEQKQSGLSIALSGTAGSALNTAVSSAQQARKSGDGRVSALQNTQAALNGVQAAQAAQMDGLQNGGEGGSNTIGVSASYGSQSSKSETRTESSQSQGSTLTAGRNLTVTATGKNDTAQSGDISITGSQLKAGGDLGLDASRDILLQSGQNTQSTDSKNSSKGGSAGVGIGAGSGGYGISVSASVNAAKGSEKGNGLTHSETTLDAGNRLSLTSGRDTTLRGAQASGESVKVDAGRNLTLASEQDSDRYDSRQQSTSAGGSVTFGSMTGSANVSRDKMHSTWQSVAEQTGIFAGKGGFDVTVGEHTQLDGAVIASTATADKNRLDTGTLGFGDIENHADYKVEHQSAGISTGGSVGGQFAGNMANGMLAGLNDSGSADSTTKSAVSEGTIVIRDKEKQAQDVADLSRDVENANPGLETIFDKEKEQNRLKAAQLIGEIGSQAGDIARTQGEIIATRKANDKMSGVTQTDRDRALAELKAKDPTKQYSADDVSKQVYSNFYNQAFADSGFGTGGKVQRAISAVTAAVQGLSGGNVAQAISGASAPYLAEKIHELTTDANGKVNTEANLMAHAVLGAVTSYAAGNSALAGASGAAMGEYIAQQLYPGVKRSDLSEEQRQTISALGTLAAGLAGGVVGDSTADAVAGAQAGKNAVENNHLSSKQIDTWSAEMKQCQAGGGDCSGIITKYEELSTAQQNQLISDCVTSPATCQQKYGDVLADSMAVKQAIDRAMGEDIPIKMVYDLTATWAHQMDADGIVASNNVSEQIMAKYGLDQAQADIIAGVALSALGGMNKAGKGSALPTPKATVASNGLVYKSNPKHTAGQLGNRPNAGIEPQDSLKLFESSVSSSKKYPNKEVRFSVDSKGNVHRFEGTNGEYHWNGSSGDEKNPLTGKQIPSDVQKQLGVKIK